MVPFRLTDCSDITSINHYIESNDENLERYHHFKPHRNGIENKGRGKIWRSSGVKYSFICTLQPVSRSKHITNVSVLL